MTFCIQSRSLYRLFGLPAGKSVAFGNRDDCEVSRLVPVGYEVARLRSLVGPAKSDTSKSCSRLGRLANSMTNEKEVLLLVELREATPYQEQQFRREMCNRDWQLMQDDRALYAAFPGATSDSGIVRASESEVCAAAEDSGIEDWEAVCVLA